jgi:hypothetical protein
MILKTSESDGTNNNNDLLPALLPAPAGGSGGSRFDSGSHPMGVSRIHIECGSLSIPGFDTCQLTIKRVFLEFHSPEATSSSTSCHPELEEKIPSYQGHACYKAVTNITFTFQLEPNDWIEQAVVWTDGILANAVQFYTKAGIESPLYGIPKDDGKRVVFGGGEHQEGSGHLVGVYGRFGGVIHSLGFKFRSKKNAPLPPRSTAAYQVVPGGEHHQAEQEEDSSWFAGADEEEVSMIAMA